MSESTEKPDMATVEAAIGMCGITLEALGGLEDAMEQIKRGIVGEALNVAMKELRQLKDTEQGMPCIERKHMLIALRTLQKLIDAHPVAESSESIEATTAHHLLHRLWTKAVGTEGYDKSEWKALEAKIATPPAPHWLPWPTHAGLWAAWHPKWQPKVAYGLAAISTYPGRDGIVVHWFHSTLFSVGPEKESGWLFQPLSVELPPPPCEETKP